MESKHHRWALRQVLINRDNATGDVTLSDFVTGSQAGLLVPEGVKFITTQHPELSAPPPTHPPAALSEHKHARPQMCDGYGAQHSDTLPGS